MSLVTTHILDTVAGTPASGVVVILSDAAGEQIARGTTDSDGRVNELGPEQLQPGSYRLSFRTGEYFRARGLPTFFPEVQITFETGAEPHYHVPLLISPYAYSTYRGS
ncbi:hydroxyisourate hydrolase [Nesterenkonia alkaliphila]|uniref:5-hydroxyisourate hydrolase n=1 Tax=Nesterenkonia alkaliphila TaxID=1463631 RepID=A0A7K1UJQ9_9MICC|nr:hydroxyisourate hydrolase [Nesterenkonia alkaliphila]MVT26700.1 hydroxyisourate hydrolase [Nesterenkonia alkaliphila]GFZ76861.1 5-hydroxyisourate hydrolase [Nesterenkonia alkaliphila]